MAKLDVLSGALAGHYARALGRDPALAELFADLLRQVEAMQHLEREDLLRHGVERAIVDSDAGSFQEVA